VGNKPVIKLTVGTDVPEGLVVLDSCGTCAHFLPAGNIGAFCNIDGSYSDAQSGTEWQWWSERHRTMGNTWCPGFERCQATFKLVRENQKTSV